MIKIHECDFKKYIFVVSGMCYTIDSSGTSKVVQAHEKMFTDIGIGYVTIFPISHSSGQGNNWRVLTTGCYAMLINGEYISAMTPYEVMNVLLEFQRRGVLCIGILIHHIIRNDIYTLKWLLEKIQGVPVVYYLHDFYTCCINPYMLKNDEESCVDGNTSCDGCCYKLRRKEHLIDVSRFLGIFPNNIVFVAPSEYIRDRWLQFYPDKADNVIVIPHQKSSGIYEGNNSPISDKEAIRIGFIGAQTHAKGWDIFKRTVNILQDAKCNYEYYYFGYGQEKLPYVKCISVEVAKMGKDAMINAIRNNGIAVAFLMYLAGETYSYTMYESHAANSYILTHVSSGNIAYTVKKKGWGYVFESDEDMIETLLDETKFRKDLNEWRKHEYTCAKTYMDNTDIIHLFPRETNGQINWEQKKSPFINRVIRCALNNIFVFTRLSNGKK